LAAAASTLATTTRISTSSNCSTTRPRFDLGCLICPGNLVGKTGLKITSKELSTSSDPPPPPPIPKLRSPNLSSLHPLTRAQRTRVHFYPEHWPLCRLVLNRVFLAALKSKLRAHTGARPSVRLCVGPELTRCVHNID
jgi:hypothetical protein